MAAPVIFSQVKVSPSVSQAITPATCGMRYMKGALRAMPRTLFTQVHESQPTNEQTTSAQKSPAHTATPSEPPCSEPRSPANDDQVRGSITGMEKSSV